MSSNVPTVNKLKFIKIDKCCLYNKFQKLQTIVELIHTPNNILYFNLSPPFNVSTLLSLSSDTNENLVLLLDNARGGQIGGAVDTSKNIVLYKRLDPNNKKEKSLIDLNIENIMPKTLHQAQIHHYMRAILIYFLEGFQGFKTSSISDIHIYLRYIYLNE